MTLPTSPRQATVSDLPAIRRLTKAAYAKYVERMDLLPEPLLHDYLAEAESGAIWVLGNPIAALIVLADEGDDGDEGDSLLIENVAVHPTAQGSGLGRRLMDFAEQQASSRGFSRVALYTNEVMIENLAIYAHLGYRETARRGDHGYRRVFMEKALSSPQARSSPASA